MACDVQSLINDAACFSCQTPGVWPILELALLCQISNAIAGGAGGSVTCGSGAPTSTPASGCGLYINTDDGTLFEYYSGSWH